MLLLIEVADGSLEYDRQTKAPMYARAGSPELWIVNLVDHVIEVYRQPSAAGYQSEQLAWRGDVLRPVSFPDLTVVVSDVLI